MVSGVEVYPVKSRLEVIHFIDTGKGIHPLQNESLAISERAMLQPGLTAPAHDRILNVARTMADLDRTSAMGPKHRTLDRTFWA